MVAGGALALAMAGLMGLGAGPQTPPIFNPGAPGAPARVISATEAVELGRTSFTADDVAFIVEVPDLPATVRLQMRGPDRALDDPVDEIRLLALGVDLFTLIEGQAHGAGPVMGKSRLGGEDGRKLRHGWPLNELRG